jgi:hypothetical protein
MKIVEFPEKEKFDEKQNAMEFLDEVRKRAEGNEVTSIVVVMMNDDGHMGMCVLADYVEANGMLALALREL